MNIFQLGNSFFHWYPSIKFFYALVYSNQILLSWVSFNQIILQSLILGYPSVKFFYLWVSRNQILLSWVFFNQIILSLGII